MSRTVILSVGNDEGVLTSRNAVLRKAGYVVVEVTSPKRAIAEFYGGDFDLVLFCHSISSDIRQHLAEAMNARCPGTPVLCVGGAGGHQGSSLLTDCPKF